MVFRSNILGFYLKFCIFIAAYMYNSTDMDYHILRLSIQIISLHLGKEGMHNHTTEEPLNLLLWPKQSFQ
jgi:hypothetical protein